MVTRIRAYVALITIAAAGALAALVAWHAQPPVNWAVALLCMAGWGFVAQVAGHRITDASTASIASIPYMAGAFLVPSWEAVAAIAISEAAASLVKRRPAIKSVFNVAQSTLAFSLTVITYRLLGGASLYSDRGFHPVGYCAGIVVFFCVNTLAVSGAVAISEKKHLIAVWRSATAGSLFYDVLSMPLPFFFAQLFIAKGVWGAILLAAPLLAVRQVFRTAWKLEQATQDLLQLMVKAIEARDPYTSGHSQRVQTYALIIGKAAGLSMRVAERLGKAALLHDVGKIHEMYAPILRKPDKLTEQEWAIMKTHPIKSAELVGTVSHLRDVVPAVRHHHENWDGTGYPDGLRGTEIPLFSRIIAIADTIDAMTTNRPYRSSRSLEQVRLELVTMAGQQFDPTLCGAVLNGPFFQKLADEIAAQNHAVSVSGGHGALRTA